MFSNLYEETDKEKIRKALQEKANEIIKENLEMLEQAKKRQQVKENQPVSSQEDEPKKSSTTPALKK